MARHERQQHAPDIEQLQLISDALPSLISYVDSDLRYQFCNRAYSEWFGLPRDRIIGKPMVEVLGVEAFRRLLPHLEQALCGQAADFEVEVAYKHGGTRWIHAMCSPHYDPQGLVIGVVVLVTDISERKAWEVALQHERERLALALIAGSMGVYDMDLVHGTFCWSPEIYAVFGVAPPFAPTRESFTALIHPDDRAPSWRHFDKTVAAHEPFIHEFRIIRPDGEIRWIASRGKTEYNAAGVPVRHFGIAIDITERKKADRRKDEYLAMLAHELRNPLAPMLNAANLIQRLGNTNTKIKRASEIMLRQVMHMARLLDDLLDVSRIARGKIILRKERFDLVELLRNVHEDHRSSLEGAGLSFRALLPQEALYVYADKTRLLQVVSNLLQNANKFTPAGGAVHLDLAREKGQVVVRVRDTGIGMPPELIREIFEPFVQAATSLDRSKGGLGLGLALAKGIVQLHGGTIAAYSEGKGAGSTFEVKLPLADENVDDRDVLDDAAESKPYRPESGVMFSSRR